MADSSQGPAELAGVDTEFDELEQEELQLALEFKAVLRELADDLAQSAAAPSISGVASAVRQEIGTIGDQLREELARDVAALHESQQQLSKYLQSQMDSLSTKTTAQATVAIEAGLTEMGTALSLQVSKHLAPVLERLASLDQLETGLRNAAESASAAADDAAKTLAKHLEESARSRDSLNGVLSSTTTALTGQAVELREAIVTVLPPLEAAARGVQMGQDSLKAMLRTYNDTLDRSLTALETKFSGLLAANLERVTQRQIELEARIRATAERTEEAVLDLMSGNQAHHQAMVDGTAASLSQLEVFNNSFQQTTSALKGLYFLSAGAIVGLVFVSYLLLMRG